MLVLLAGVVALSVAPRSGAFAEAPEAQKVRAAQASVPFQILTPAYLPGGFDRTAAAVRVAKDGPSGEPMVELAYRNGRGGTLFLREWMPSRPGQESLAGGKPIQTRWGESLLLASAAGASVLWVDVDAVRVATYSSGPEPLDDEEIVQITESLGPTSGRPVYTSASARQPIRIIPPAPPTAALTNAEGVQEITLVVTAGGYNPARFSVMKGVPVKLVFRQLGQVGCGNTLILQTNAQSTTSLTLASETDTQALTFTPEQAGDFTFQCPHDIYRGTMIVRE